MVTVIILVNLRNFVEELEVLHATVNGFTEIKNLSNVLLSKKLHYKESHAHYHGRLKYLY